MNVATPFFLFFFFFCLSSTDQRSANALFCWVLSLHIISQCSHAVGLKPGPCCILLLCYLSQESRLAPFFTFLFDVNYQIFMYTSRNNVTIQNCIFICAETSFFQFSHYSQCQCISVLWLLWLLPQPWWFKMRGVYSAKVLEAIISFTGPKIKVSAKPCSLWSFTGGIQSWSLPDSLLPAFFSFDRSISVRTS